VNYSIRKENKREIPPLPAAAGEGEASPDHIVVLRHLPGEAGQISATHTDDGFYILEIEEIEYAETYRWWRNDTIYADGMTVSNISIPDTAAGVYCVAGVNNYGEGLRSPGYEIEEPPAVDDPMPGPRQYTYAGTVYNRRK